MTPPAKSSPRKKSAQEDKGAGYTTTRETASESLGVSTRTLDRYLKTGKLRSKSIKRKVFVHSDDLTKLADRLKKKPKQRKKTVYSGPAAEATVTVENAPEEKVFRELYSEATAELKTKQEKLEAASFRVGQLETQLKNSVPLLEYKQKEDELSGENKRLREKLVTTVLKGWIFLGAAIVATMIAAALGILIYLY
ncbi:MAG: hypothetical protein ABIH35_01605 [Patescibacteria group bacterium]